MRIPRKPSAVFGAALSVWSIWLAGAAVFSSMAGAATPPKKLALLVGINAYRHHENFNDLFGAVNDAILIGDVLTTGRFGFDPKDVAILTDQQATRAGIIKAFRELVSKASAGDEVVFYYAGHGSTVPDPARPSGQEQTIVPHDSRDPGGKIFDITDGELRDLFGELRQKTNNITAIMDSCNSGTAIRGNLTRGIPQDTRRQPPRRGTRGATVGAEDRGIVFIAGARANQLSNESLFGGAKHGALSWHLAAALKASSPDATWRDVMDTVGPTVTRRYPTQEPQLEGSAGGKIIFGGAAVASEPYYLMVAGSPNMILKGGSIHGLGQGSMFDVYAPGTKSFGPNDAKPLGRVQLEKVLLATSETNASKSAFPVGSRAVERQRSFPDFRFRILWPQAGLSAVADSVRKNLVQPLFEATEDPTIADFQIRLEGNRIITTGADGSPLSSPLDQTGSEAEGRLLERVERWAKWFQLLGLDSTGSKNAISISIVPDQPRADGKVSENTDVTIRIRNHSSERLNVALLDLASSGAVDTIPITNLGTEDAIPPGGEISTRAQFIVPEGAEFSRDVLKVFATKTKVSFEPLIQPGIRGTVGTDPLSQLFSAAVQGTREPVKPVPVNDWASATASLVVVKE